LFDVKVLQDAAVKIGIAILLAGFLGFVLEQDVFLLQAIWLVVFGVIMIFIGAKKQPNEDRENL